MHYLQGWACEDFDLFEFVGQDDTDHSFTGSQQDIYPSSSGQQFEPSDKQEKDDYMYSIMQYNDVAYDNHQQQQMYGHQDMNGGFMQEDRYQQNPAASGLLNSTINKLHQSQQLSNQLPSTSRLSTVTNNPQSYASRMRPQLQSQMGQPSQLNGDLSENVLLPTSSQSPQNQNGNMYLPQTLIKSEPQYNELGHDEYFDSTSDTESRYSGSRSLVTGGSAKPRKYRIKPESEKVTPQYRQKRAKNNDAVRRSREKAKHTQLEKEKRLHFLENEHNEHYKAMNALKQRVRELETENMALRKSCSCGTSQQIPPFRR